MKSNNKPMLLGELLIRAGVLSYAMLPEVLKQAQQSNLPLGKVLTWLGYLNEKQLKAALETQSLVNDDVITPELAVSVLRLASEKRTDIESALNELGCSFSGLKQRNRLGDLLIAGGLITSTQLDEVLDSAAATQLPLGQLLSWQGETMPLYVSSALAAQTLIREGRISREQAIEALKLVKQHGASFETVLLELGIKETVMLRHLEIAELLLNTGVITRAQLFSAIEYSFESDKSIGASLTDLGFVKEPLLAAARQLKRMVSSHETTREEAVQAIRHIYQDNLTVEQALAMEVVRRASLPKLTALDLVRLANLANNEGSQRGSSKSGASSGSEDVLVGKIVDERTLASVMECLALVESNKLTLQQAIAALNITMRKKVSIKDAFDALGIDANK